MHLYFEKSGLVRRYRLSRPRCRVTTSAALEGRTTLSGCSGRGQRLAFPKMGAARDARNANAVQWKHTRIAEVRRRLHVRRFPRQSIGRRHGYKLKAVAEAELRGFRSNPPSSFWRACPWVGLLHEWLHFRLSTQTEGLAGSEQSRRIGGSDERIVALEIKCVSVRRRRELVRRLQVPLERFECFATT